MNSKITNLHFGLNFDGHDSGVFVVSDEKEEVFAIPCLKGDKHIIHLLNLDLF